METKAVYAVASGIRARKESFGLLFYDTRHPRLIFVRSRDLLFLAGDPFHGCVIDTQARCQADAARARRILNDLRDKGLIQEAPPGVR